MSRKKTRSSSERFRTRVPGARIALRRAACLLAVPFIVGAAVAPAAAGPQNRGSVRQGGDPDRPHVTIATDVRSGDRAAPGIVPGGKVSPLPVPALECRIDNDFERKEASFKVRNTSAAPIPAGYAIEWRCQRVTQAVSKGKTSKNSLPQEGVHLLPAPLPSGRWLEIKRFTDVTTKKGWDGGMSTTSYSECRTSVKPTGERQGAPAPSRSY